MTRLSRWALFAGLGLCCSAALAALPPDDDRPDRPEHLPPPPPGEMEPDDHDPMLEGMELGGPDRMGPGRPGPGRPGEGPHGDRRPPGPSEEQLAALQAFVKEHFPEMARRIEEVQKDDPQFAKRMVRRLWPRMQMIKDQYDRDPQGLGRLVVQDHRIEMQIREKAREARMEPNADKKQAAQGELRSLLEQQWQVRVDRRKYELDDLEKRLNEQRARLQKREAAKAEMIQRQYDRLIGEADVDW